MKKTIKRSEKIQFSPKGVFITDRHGKRIIAAPIRYRSVGTRIADNTMVAKISFMNFDGEHLSQIFDLSDFLPKNRNKVVERLTNRGYRWPSGKGLIEAILVALMAELPKRRFTMVAAPGWYDGTYVLPDSEYGSHPLRHRSFLIDVATGAKVAPFQTGEGSLERWQKTVARVAKKSSCLRLAIAAAFAAPVLRPLGMDSFGLNSYGKTSTGKSTTLLASASVAGVIGHGGLPGWADSEAAIEQLLMGHRDSILPLDETGDGEKKTSLAKRGRLLAFAISRNRLRNLDKGYEKSSKLTSRDCRNIVLSSSERALGSVAVAEGSPRLPGEEVRLIDVPATDSYSNGIFDGTLKLEDSRSPLQQAQIVIDQLRKDAVLNQGFALRKFLREFTNDTGALAALKRYRNDFEERAPVSTFQSSDTRIRANFAVIYAAAVLAIDYEILPWKKTATFKAINKCMTAALQAKLELTNSQSIVTPVADVAENLRKDLARLNIIKITKRTKASARDAEQREQADGFSVGEEIYVKPKSCNGITTAIKAILIEHKILRTERNDAPTMARKISGIKGKPRYYVVDAVALDEAIAGFAQKQT